VSGQFGKGDFKSLIVFDVGFQTEPGTFLPFLMCFEKVGMY